jgi:14-3-3 protein epsilon
LLQFEEGSHSTILEERAAKHYSLATDSALKLPSTHPVRLALACNYAAFHVEVRTDFDLALKIANEAFEASLEKFQDVPLREQEATLKAMVLIEDNITLWKVDQERRQKRTEAIKKTDHVE